MRRSKVILTLILLFICMGSAFASFSFHPYVSGWFGVSLCHPTAEYLQKSAGDGQNGTPFFRTSSSFGFDAQLLEAMITFENGNAISFGAGFSYLNVSESLPYGNSILKPYSGYGFSFDAGYHFNRSFDLSFRYKFFQCFFSGSSARFVAHEFELSPYYRFADLDSLKLFVGTPVSLFWKADSVSINAAVCFLVSVDSLKIRFKK